MSRGPDGTPREPHRRGERRSPEEAAAFREEQERLRAARRVTDSGHVPTGALDAARAELDARPPLVVEPLPEKLKRLVPGARLENDPRSQWPWAVWRGLSILAVAMTPREAVERAIALKGSR